MRKAPVARTITVLLAVLLAAVALPAVAYAAVLASTQASQKYTVLTWKAVAVAPGASAGTGAYTTASFDGSADKRAVAFDIVNTGTSAISGFTLSSTLSGTLKSGTSISYTTCAAAAGWVFDTKKKTFSCAGAKNQIASISGGAGSASISAKLAAGARVNVLAEGTASGPTITVGQTITITVARSQAAAKRNR
jgi:hypothetical protein